MIEYSIKTCELQGSFSAVIALKIHLDRGSLTLPEDLVFPSLKLFDESLSVTWGFLSDCKKYREVRMTIHRSNKEDLYLAINLTLKASMNTLLMVYNLNTNVVKTCSLSLEGLKSVVADDNYKFI